MLNCFMIGVMLYCGNSGPPVAMITPQTQRPTPPVSNGYVTPYRERSIQEMVADSRKCANIPKWWRDNGMKCDP